MPFAERLPSEPEVLDLASCPADKGGPWVLTFAWPLGAIPLDPLPSTLLGLEILGRLESAAGFPPFLQSVK